MAKHWRTYHLSAGLALFVFLTVCIHVSSQDNYSSPDDYDEYEKLVAEVKSHRAERIISLDEFNEMSKDECVVILDVRSKEMYDLKHIKGAINLDFSEFSAKNLDLLLESKDVKILIYCNNNIEENRFKRAYMSPDYFPTKCANPKRNFAGLVEYFPPQIVGGNPKQLVSKIHLGQAGNVQAEHQVFLPMTIPSYIHLYGLGYKNVYELGEVVDVFDQRISFGGTTVQDLE